MLIHILVLHLFLSSSSNHLYFRIIIHLRLVVECTCYAMLCCAQVRLSPSSRTPQCTVTFDGRHLRRFERGDRLLISTGAYSVPCVSSSNAMCDWFQSLDDCLHWNHHEQRRPLQHLPSNCNLVQLAASDSESDLPPPQSRRQKAAGGKADASAAQPHHLRTISGESISDVTSSSEADADEPEPEELLTRPALARSAPNSNSNSNSKLCVNQSATIQKVPLSQQKSAPLDGNSARPASSFGAGGPAVGGSLSARLAAIQFPKRSPLTSSSSLHSEMRAMASSLSMPGFKQDDDDEIAEECSPGSLVRRASLESANAEGFEGGGGGCGGERRPSAGFLRRAPRRHKLATIPSVDADAEEAEDRLSRSKQVSEKPSFLGAVPSIEIVEEPSEEQ